MRGNCWVVVLAGGEGTRIQPLIKRCLGTNCPKQYVAFCGDRSMIEHTQERAVDLAGEDRTLTVIGHGHRSYLKDLSIRGEIIEQPVSRGTGAGIFFAASIIRARDPNATVIIFPSDHFICPRSEFLEQAEKAKCLAQLNPQKMVLLGIEPDIPETDYGWIQPGHLVKGRFAKAGGFREILNFNEKPSLENATRWVSQGYLWNTMIVAASVKLLWKQGIQLLPDSFDYFIQFSSRLKTELRSGLRNTAVQKLFRNIPAFDFSREILKKSVRRSVVLPLENLLWSDWGRPERVFHTLQEIRREPRLFSPEFT